MARRSWDKRRTVPVYNQGASVRADELDRALRVPDIRVQRESQRVILTWRFVDGKEPELPDGYTWSIERSGSPGGEFELVHQGLPAGPGQVRDDDLPRGFENVRHMYYRLVAVDADGERIATYGLNAEWDRPVKGDEETVYGITWGAKGSRTEYSPGVVREIRNRVGMMLDHVAGVTLYWHRPAWTRGHCTACINPRTGTRRPSRGDYCDRCFDTGFEGGFYPAMLTRKIPVTQPIARMQIPLGTKDNVEDQRVVMPYFPLIEPRDYVRELDGTIWAVTDVYYADMYGHAAFVVASLSQMPRTHTLSKLPMPEGHRELSHGPRRQYARAMTQESYRRSLAEGSMNRASFLPLDDYQTDDS